MPGFFFGYAAEYLPLAHRTAFAVEPGLEADVAATGLFVARQACPELATPAGFVGVAFAGQGVRTDAAGHPSVEDDIAIGFVELEQGLGGPDQAMEEPTGGRFLAGEAGHLTYFIDRLIARHNRYRQNNRT
jgi:hypothetical protein